MTVEQMRKSISEVYTSNKWKNRVAMMPSAQVKAIYFRMLETNAFDKKKKSDDGQMSVFDFIGRK